MTSTNRRDHMNFNELPISGSGFLKINHGIPLNFLGTTAKGPDTNVIFPSGQTDTYGQGVLKINHGIPLNFLGTTAKGPDTNVIFPSGLIFTSSQTDTNVFNAPPTATSITISDKGVLTINGETIDSESTVVNVTGNNINIYQE